MKVRAPVRASHTYRQRLAAPVTEVFALLCPVRETEWVPGWEPDLVVSASGVAEEGCVFVTRGVDGPATWVITRYEPPRRIELLKLTPRVTVGRISILLAPDGDDACTADVTYTYTALGPEGEAAVAAFTSEAHDAEMAEREADLNHYLRHGTRREREEGA